MIYPQLGKSWSRYGRDFVEQQSELVVLGIMDGDPRLVAMGMMDGDARFLSSTSCSPSFSSSCSSPSKSYRSQSYMPFLVEISYCLGTNALCSRFSHICGLVLPDAGEACRRWLLLADGETTKAE